MAGLPLIIVAGGDELALRVCEELCSTQGHDVVLLWQGENELGARASAVGARFVARAPNDYEALRTAGVMHAASIMPVSEDDRLNLHVALKARDLNSNIRIVLRQFNRTLARKLEHNLPDCSAVSVSSHAAATYAGAAVDPGCFFALQFPDFDGPLLGFSERTAAQYGTPGMTLAEMEQRLGARMIAVDGAVCESLDVVPEADQHLIAFGPMAALRDAWPARVEPSDRVLSRLRRGWGDVIRSARRTEPIVANVFLVGLAAYGAAIWYFMWTLNLNFIQALYYTTAAVSSLHYGAVTPSAENAHVGGFVVSLLAMGVGLVMSGVFIAAVTSALERAQFTALRGLRHLRGGDHVVVCGAGKIGTRVIDFLLQMKQRVFVIEPEPDALVIQRARDRHIDLLTGDASDEVTLGFCDLSQARSVVALSSSDTINLEIGLGSRAKAPDVNVVLRIMEGAFARSIARQFQIRKSFSMTELTAPAIAGLSRFPGTRGRIAFGDEEYNVGERLQGAIPAPPPADRCIPLYVWRDGGLRPIHDFAEMEPYDRLLFIVPLSQFRTRKAGAGAEHLEFATT
ncbi:MAG: hypothetical protein NVS1B14_01170 [Vulcanimicrobiaceae bacterium]